MRRMKTTFKADGTEAQVPLLIGRKRRLPVPQGSCLLLVRLQTLYTLLFRPRLTTRPQWRLLLLWL